MWGLGGIKNPLMLIIKGLRLDFIALVIRLEFHFLRQFVEKSSVLLSFQKFYKSLYTNNI